MSRSPVTFVCNVVVPVLVTLTSLSAGAERIAYSSGDLTAPEAVGVLYLAWPQSYNAMIDRLGYPAYRSSTADFYRRPDGDLLRVDYDQNNTAIGYGWETH